MGLHDRKPSEIKRLLKSFGHAGEGIKDAFLHERNFQIHCFLGAAAAAAGAVLGISPVEWFTVIGFSCLVLSLELVNTAIERTVDLVTEEIRPLAKAAKDAAAGAVLVSAAGACLAGLIIFVPKLIKFIIF
ncbi:diacylglycerol kinase [Bacillus mangrovi]|uniref:Diacylglycerol kinase n=1 Tax=Metabacillus mangrovi TaxID=1491830 RepID=A0A7X2S3C3_9BACI|nr:diacylglycerol kinase [Metabacillus mangrovi]MTH52466.1 diacylglycerol kinase [Metabacillus mangrovi]